MYWNWLNLTIVTTRLQPVPRPALPLAQLHPPRWPLAPTDAVVVVSSMMRAMLVVLVVDSSTRKMRKRKSQSLRKGNYKWECHFTSLSCLYIKCIHLNRSTDGKQAAKTESDKTATSSSDVFGLEVQSGFSLPEGFTNNRFGVTFGTTTIITTTTSISTSTLTATCAR